MASPPSSAPELAAGDRVPVLPLRDVVLFPHVVMPLLVGRPASLAAVDAAGAADKQILLVAQRSADVQEPASADLYRVGVVGRIHQLASLANGATKVLVEGLTRVRVTRYAQAGGTHLRATLAPAPFGDPAATAEARAVVRRVLSLFEEYVSLHRRIPDEVVAMVQGADDETRQAFAVAAHVTVRPEVRQRLLEVPTLAELWAELGELLAAEIELLRLERKIEEDVRGSLVQSQREFYLQEQLKAIHKELGNDDGDDAADLQAAVEAKGLPEPVRVRALREVRKLRRTSPLSPEATVSRNYLDWVLGLPWTERTDDVLDVAHARAVLDADHFGLDDVKDRVLDHIAVMALVGKMSGPVLCLVGPPGVGKTSLGRSVARALGRKFMRVSLGGVRDEAEIRGHRRTYIGSMPGRIVQAMRKAEAVNPVILLDEVDKLGQDYRGDPSAALLEVLDPEQNHAFNDHYLEVDYDLSQVLFVTTANSLAGIPEALRDRMEVIRLAGYLDGEKVAIAERHLIPKQLRLNGLAPDHVSWEPGALQAILRGYTREAGVRELERRLARVARKLARKLAETTPAGLPAAGSLADHAEGPAEGAGSRQADELVVRAADLKSLLGTAPHADDDQRLDDKVGVATGLAYTTVGGETLEIEVSSVAGRGKLQLTGTLGDVMKESAHAAVSYARSRAGALGIDAEFHRVTDLHLHIPAGATPKDGPSAGIAIATAIVSALTGVAVRGDVAMTGEITLRGRVLAIGGLKEKLVAARRAGVSRVIIPAENERELDDVPADVVAALRIHPVSSMDDVLAVALRQPARPDAPGAARAAR
ncbi:MAG: ATP-dependent protease La Type I, partial [uncultured Gemmatimonadaceae bacterium]